MHLRPKFGNKFFPAFTEYMHRAVLQPAKEDKLRNVLRGLNTFFFGLTLQKQQTRQNARR